MNPERISRLPYNESCRQLQSQGHLRAEIPALPSHRPQVGDDGSPGIRFFSTLLEECRLDNLTLPRTFFGRSEVVSVSFENTDLHESTLCWNDFNEVTFTDADLSDCDLRASIFRDTSFVRANLRNSDLRRSNFKECDFTDADMRGAKLTRKQGEQTHLSERQKAEVDWQESDGEQPPGG